MQDLTTVAPVGDQVKPVERQPRRRYASEDRFTAHAVDGTLPDRDEAATQLYPFLLRVAKRRPLQGMTHRDLAQAAALFFLRTFPRYLPDGRGVWFTAARIVAAARALEKGPLAQLKRRCQGQVRPLGRDRVDEGAPEPANRLAIPDQVEAMLAELGRTDEAHAEVLRLRYLEERGVREIADELDLTAGDVGRCLQRARSFLRKRYAVISVAQTSRAVRERAAIAEREHFREERRRKAEELARQGHSACAIARLLGASRGLARRAVYRVQGRTVVGM